MYVLLALTRMLIWVKQEFHHGEKQLNVFSQMDFRSSFLFSVDKCFSTLLYTTSHVTYFVSPPEGGPSVHMYSGFSCDRLILLGLMCMCVIFVFCSVCMFFQT